MLKIELRRGRGFTRPLIKLGFVGDFVLCNKIDVTIGVNSAFIYWTLNFLDLIHFLFNHSYYVLFTSQFLEQFLSANNEVCRASTSLYFPFTLCSIWLVSSFTNMLFNYIKYIIGFDFYYIIVWLVD